MSGISININNADKIQRLIKIRNKELGQTTKQSASALAVNIMSSLKKDTKVANERKLNLTVQDVTASYKYSFSASLNRPCFRNANGIRVELPKAWKVLKSSSGKRNKSILVVDNDVNITFLIVCETADEAKAIAKEKHIKRVRRHKGLAKAALGIAQAKIANKSGISDILNQKVKQSALNNIKVDITDDGFDSGNVTIRVLDALDYAADALKSGKGYEKTAIQNAINKMTGQIMHTLKQRGSLDDSLKLELESLIERNA